MQVTDSQIYMLHLPYGTGSIVRVHHSSLNVNIVGSTYILWECSTASTKPISLLTINQTEFMIDAEPTWRGWTQWTWDMMEVMACICGIPVDSSSRNSNVAIQCGYKGCEMLWVCSCLPSLSDVQLMSWPFVVPSGLPQLRCGTSKLALFEPCSTY